MTSYVEGLCIFLCVRFWTLVSGARPIIPNRLFVFAFGWVFFLLTITCFLSCFTAIEMFRVQTRELNTRDYVY